MFKLGFEDILIINDQYYMQESGLNEYCYLEKTWLFVYELTWYDRIINITKNNTMFRAVTIKSKIRTPLIF